MVEKMNSKLMVDDEKRVWFSAGRIADLSLSLVGGKGLNGRIKAVEWVDLSTYVKELKSELLNYSECVAESQIQLDDKFLHFANEMVRCATNFVNTNTLESISQLAKELRNATEEYNYFIYELSKMSYCIYELIESKES